MYLMISYSSFIVNKIRYLCLKSHPVLLSSNSCLILIITSLGISGGLPLLSFTFQSIQSIFIISIYHLYAQASTYMQFFCYIFYVFFVFIIRLTSKILSFTSASFSLLYTTSSLDVIFKY